MPADFVVAQHAARDFTKQNSSHSPYFAAIVFPRASRTNSRDNKS